jgi:hypothetical protein
MVFPPVLASPNVPVVFCAAVGPRVAVVISAVNVPAVTGVSALALPLLLE